jgi:hypothetical protein
MFGLCVCQCVCPLREGLAPQEGGVTLNIFLEQIDQPCRQVRAHVPGDGGPPNVPVPQQGQMPLPASSSNSSHSCHGSPPPPLFRCVRTVSSCTGTRTSTPPAGPSGAADKYSNKRSNNNKVLFVISRGVKCHSSYLSAQLGLRLNLLNKLFESTISCIDKYFIR